MDEVILWLKNLFIVTIMFDAALYTVLLIVCNYVRDISKANKLENEEKEIVYSIKCVGRKPTESKSKWFTFNKEYVVRDNHVFDDTGIKWCVFKYDKIMLEAGDYLFCKVTKSKQED